MGARPKTVKVGIFYQMDPGVTVAGGIETFIKGMLRWTPPDIEMCLIGVTTDPVARPLGRWTTCGDARSSFRFYPVLHVEDLRRRLLFPLSIRFSLALARHARQCAADHDVLEFHRIEPSLLFLSDPRPKNAFVHQNMAELHNRKADIRWKYVPSLFYRLEDILLPRMQSVFTVREDAMENYRMRYPQIRDRFHFTPTWMDPDVFYPATGRERTELRKKVAEEYGLNADHALLVTVGRLDLQKDPLLLLDAFLRVLRVRPETQLLMIGDGVLRETISTRINELGMADRVFLAGLLAQSRIADVLRCADLFVLSSAYEGMPMCVLEAMGCGLAVASTDVGEVRRVVDPGVNGAIASERTPDALARAVLDGLENGGTYAGKPCTAAVADFVPRKVLAPVHQAYRAMAASEHGWLQRAGRT